LSLERVMGTRDSHAHGNVLMMGSVSCCPSTTWTTSGCYGFFSTELAIGEYFG
jgi:hypothetical protein